MSTWTEGFNTLRASIKEMGGLFPPRRFKLPPQEPSAVQSGFTFGSNWGGKIWLRTETNLHRQVQTVQLNARWIAPVGPRPPGPYEGTLFIKENWNLADLVYNADLDGSYGMGSNFTGLSSGHWELLFSASNDYGATFYPTSLFFANP